VNPLVHESAASLPRTALLALGALRVLLALFFLFVAGKNLAGDAQMSADFSRWGYPDWFRVVTALIQVGGGLLLLSSRTTFVGSAILACVLVGAAWTHLRHDPPVTTLSPLVFLVLVGVVFYAFRPELLRGA